MGYRVQSESDAYLIGQCLRYGADLFERDADAIKTTSNSPRSESSFRIEGAMREQARRARVLAHAIETITEGDR